MALSIRLALVAALLFAFATGVAGLAQADPDEFEGWWAMSHTPATVWSGPGPDANAWGTISQWRYLRVLQPEQAGRVLTLDPRTEGYGFIDVAALGPVGSPPPDYLAPPPLDGESLALLGRVIGFPDSYERPERQDYFSLNRLTHNQPVVIVGAVEATDGGRWYRIGPAEYVQDGRVRIPAAPEQVRQGRWIDADLNEPAMVTAYEGDRPVYSALAVKGAVAYQTPMGVYRILRRVQNEIMDSATIGIPRSSPNGYYLKDVLYTQYFTGDGAALHYNYWRSDWGYAGSKGCLGMNIRDSRFFWDFATVGTIVHVHG
jgi:hypothetical protein